MKVSSALNNLWKTLILTLFFKQCGIPPFEPEDLDLPKNMDIDTTDPVEHAHVLDVVKMKAKQRVNSKFTSFQPVIRLLNF